MCSHHATAALNCSPHRARAAIHASPPHPSIHGGRRNPSLPHRARSLGPASLAPHHTVVVFLPMPPPFSFPVRRVLPLLSIAGQLSFSPTGFTSANEPRLHRRLLGPAGSSSPTRSHPIHQPGSRVPLPLRTLSSSSFTAAGTSFEKRSIDLVDHGRPIGAVVFMQRGVLKVCLRTTDSIVNTSEIAKAYGGGGKRSSSSFTLRMDEFNIWTSVNS
ncbi:hypothetical protein ZEAMMB73_Zm00001d017561 [Zea mays]|uniref:Uncharacterized protein n=1 Tax=Zea mays TaxID=4577 RepID=A0A1D6HFN8_MAIZE|nr:hypothetical protein ZEAMMB73_Zm00001d017561 [Zea mays]